MSLRDVTAAILKRHPEINELSQKQIKLVKTAIAEAAILASRDVLNREETEKTFKALVPDSGTPSKALRAYRNRAGLTQMALSKKTDVPQPHIAAMETGQRTIGLAIAKKLALALGINYKKLV